MVIVNYKNLDVLLLQQWPVLVILWTKIDKATHIMHTIRQDGTKAPLKLLPLNILMLFFAKRLMRTWVC
jgi:hypothetical protein